MRLLDRLLKQICRNLSPLFGGFVPKYHITSPRTICFIRWTNVKMSLSSSKLLNEIVTSEHIALMIDMKMMNYSSPSSACSTFWLVEDWLYCAAVSLAFAERAMMTMVVGVEESPRYAITSNTMERHESCDMMFSWGSSDSVVYSTLENYGNQSVAVLDT